MGILTTAEIRALIAKLLLAVLAQPTFVCAWSHWRRYHQAIAAICHRKRRSNAQL